MNAQERQKLYDLKLRSKFGEKLDKRDMSFVLTMLNTYPVEFEQVEKEIVTESMRRMNPSYENKSR